MIQVNESDIDKITEVFYAILKGKKPVPIELPPDYPDNEIRQAVGYINKFIAEYNQMTDFVYHLGRGEINVEPLRGNMIIFQSLKALHASLRNLTWITKQVAAGDFSQQVSFMGEFSAAFNSMTEQLQISFQERKRTTDDLHNQIGEMDKARKAMLNILEDLDVARQEADSAAKTKADFLANMSHEIRTPMNAIIGFSELLLDDPLTDSQQKFARTILDCSHGLLNLINDILDFSKIEAGKLDIEWLPCHLGDLLNEIAALFETATLEKGLTLDTDIDPAAPPQIITDPGRLKQCLVNLVSNAVKFTESGSVRIRLRTESTDPDSVLCIEISDTGIGIESGLIDSIFNPYVQADRSTTRRYGGTGLGLAITQKLIHLLGGQIQVVSTPGKGSVFSLVLPRQPKSLQPSQAPTDRQTQSSDSPSAPMDPVHTAPPLARVLVIEDDSANQMMMSMMLRRLGYEVECVSDGDKALQTALTQSFDLILTDRHLGDHDGLDIARQLRRAKLEIPIVLVTADTRPTLQSESVAAGCTACILKPVTRQQIRDLLRTLLPGRARKEGGDSRIPNLIHQLSGLLDSGCRYRAMRLIQCLMFACRAADLPGPLQEAQTLLGQVAAEQWDTARQTLARMENTINSQVPQVLSAAPG
jgi:two-component system, sensor histidine kinase and response regulator